MATALIAKLSKQKTTLLRICKRNFCMKHKNGCYLVVIKCSLRVGQPKYPHTSF